MQTHPFNTAHDYNPVKVDSNKQSLSKRGVYAVPTVFRYCTHFEGIVSEMNGGNDPKPANAPVVDLSKPRYDQTTYVGRAKHFFETANPKNVFVSSKRLEEAAKLIRAYK